jgi:hypothetical protein
MKLKDIHNFLEDLYHGNPKTGVISQVHQVMNGLPPFDKFCNKQTEMVVTGSVDANANAASLVATKARFVSIRIIVFSWVRHHAYCT